MRFCTSELKTAIICRELVRRFPGQTILSVSGIRREESTKRKLAPIVKVQPKLTSYNTRHERL
jgi:3'-phosphoadenosine 5'-phosphosulfate sulfotransferase (PAPS reductase)/FAD synthetase